MDSVFMEYNVILAHCLAQFSGAGNVSSNGRSLYEKIEYVVNNKPEICCSTIKEKDTLEYLERTNFFGPVGLILNQTRITYASPTDGGIFVGISGQREYLFSDSTIPTKKNIENAIICRNEVSYNELCADNYNIFGIFLCYDDMEYLIQSINSEEDFYKKTHSLNVQYFNLSHGRLFSSIYDAKTKIFVCKSSFITTDIYR